MTVILALSTIVVKELYRKKDFYVLFVITALITLLMGSQIFFKDDNAARYLKEISLLLIWISALFIAIATAAKQIPAERENRTIFPLLAKPVSRGEVVLGKFLGCWLATGLALFVFYSFFSVISGSRERHWEWMVYLQALWLHWVLLAIIVAMTLCGSLVFTAPSSNGTICFIVALGILFLGRHLNKVALQMQEPGQSILYAIYFAIPHLEFFDVRARVIHSSEPVGWWFAGLATVYGLAYAIMFLIGSWLLFRRKPLN